jgi:CheY-like chemotaxis protein
VRRGETSLQEVERVIGDVIDDTPKEGGPSAILIVHADPAWRNMARTMLEGGGFKVSEAADANQAKQMMSSGEEFALMVTDLMMPALGAAGARAALQAPPATPQIPAATPASRRPSVAIPLQVSTGTDGKPDQNVDWAKFAATVQAATKKPE